jgi:uncharacterized protein YciI
MSRIFRVMRSLIAWLILASFAVHAETPPAGEKLFLVQFTVGDAWAKEKAPQEQAYFAEHSANLKRLRTEGKLLLGGRYSDKGILIVRGPSEEAVRADIDQDPSVVNHTFNAAVYPFGTFYDGCVERSK